MNRKEMSPASRPLQLQHVIYGVYHITLSHAMYQKIKVMDTNTHSVHHTLYIINHNQNYVGMLHLPSPRSVHIWCLHTGDVAGRQGCPRSFNSMNEGIIHPLLSFAPALCSYFLFLFLCLV